MPATPLRRNSVRVYSTGPSSCLGNDSRREKAQQPGLVEDPAAYSLSGHLELLGKTANPLVSVDATLTEFGEGIRSAPTPPLSSAAMSLRCDSAKSLYLCVSVVELDRCGVSRQRARAW